MKFRFLLIALLASMACADVTTSVTPFLPLNIVSPTNNQVLTYQSSTGTWINAAASGGSSFTAGGDLSGTSTSQTVVAGAITLAKMANLAANSLICNNTGSPGVPIACTVAQTWTLLAAVPAANMPALTGDVTSTAGTVATTVGKINGVALSSLGTGLLKNTTTTGVPSIAVAADLPTVPLGTGVSGTLLAAQFPALTGGDCTTSAGSLALTCTKTNGTAFGTFATTSSGTSLTLSGFATGATALTITEPNSFTGSAILINSGTGLNTLLDFAIQSNGTTEFSVSGAGVVTGVKFTVTGGTCSTAVAALVNVSSTSITECGGTTASSVAASATFQSVPLVSGAGSTKFTVSGCGTIATSTGGGAAGQFTCATGASPATLTFTINGATGSTAPNGWSCHASDITSGIDLPETTGGSATTAVVKGNVATSDVVKFFCIGY